MPKTLTRYEAMTVRAQLAGAGSREDLRGWAHGVLTGISAGARVPPAIRHPLGFVCVQLYRDSGWGLCMHIWGPPGTAAAPATSPVHAHSWDLTSQVLCGRLENTEIHVADAESAPTHRILEITSTDGCDFIRPTQRLACCVNTVTAFIGAGESYQLPAGSFHLSRPEAPGLTVTVLLAEDRFKSPELALGQLDSTGHVVRRQACPVSDLRDMAGRALHDLHPQVWPGSARSVRSLP